MSVLLLGGAAAAAPGTVFGAAPSCVAAVEARDAAVSLARSCNVPVEVLSLRTELDQVWALPDGLFKTERHARPVRVRKADNSWTAVDTTLRFAADGSVVPAATAAQMVFSGGGSTPLVRLSSSGRTLAVGAPFGPLPRPVLDGNEATYPDVLAGVDLRLTADVEGYTEVLIVKDRAAAANPALATITFAVSGPGLAMMADADGNVRVVDERGAPVWGGPTPTMWDTADEIMASTDPGLIDRIGVRPVPALTTQLATAAGVRLPAGVAGTPGALSQLSVSPSQAYLQDPATLYPVFIDPPQTNYKMNWTYVSADCGSCTNYNSADDAQTGPIGGHTHRSFFQMSLSGLQYKNILSANFVIDLKWTASSYWKETELWEVGEIYTWTKWTSQPNKIANLGQVVLNAPANGVSWNITSYMQTASSSGWNYDTFGLYSLSDTDWAYGKQWSNSPKIVVVWNDAPNTPGVQGLYASECYQQCSSPAVVRTATPRLRAQLSDPNSGDLVRGDFEVRATASDTGTLLASGTTAAVTSGGMQDWQVPPGVLANGSTTYWRVRARDDYNWLSGWTTWQTLTVDLSAPSTPSASSAQYPPGAWGALVGTQGTFTLSDTSTDTAEFEWWVDGGSHTITNATGTNPRTASVSYTPPTGMGHTLSVKAKDKAGNISATYVYQFLVTPGVDRFSHWALDETSGTTAADSGNGQTVGGVLSPATLSGTGVAFGPGHVGGSNGLVFTGNAQAATSGPVLDTTKAFTVMAWVNPSDLSADRVIVSQDGTNSSRFLLHFDKDANSGGGGWCFSMRVTDGATPVDACADGSLIPATVGTWVHLAGVYDPLNAEGKQLRVYVMGDPESCFDPLPEAASASFSGSWTATGAFVIGRGRSGGADSSYWRGSVDDVYAHQKVLTGQQICQQAQP